MKYRPSNGTEGEMFLSAFCEHCIHERFLNTQKDGDKKCGILDKMILLDTDHKNYPEELTYDSSGFAVCTAYIHWDWDNDSDPDDPRNPKAPIPPDPNQLVLFTFSEALDEILNEKKLAEMTK